MDEPAFVPRGIDSDSGLGFEQRIQQRRFHALIDVARHALAAGDRQAAVSALTEARELNPDADELTALEVRAATQAESRGWTDPRRLVALLAVGAALLFSLNLLRDPVEAPAPATAVQERSESAPAPAATTGISETPAAERRRPAPGVSAPAIPRDSLAAPAEPLTDEGRVAFALRRYARTFTGFNFADCAIAMRDKAATAVCRAVPASAPTSLAGDSPLWDVELSLHDEGWMIDSALAQEK